MPADSVVVPHIPHLVFDRVTTLDAFAQTLDQPAKHELSNLIDTIQITLDRMRRQGRLNDGLGQYVRKVMELDPGFVDIINKAATETT